MLGVTRTCVLGVLKGFVRGARRGPLHPKHGNKNFYKGYGAKATGWHTRKGGYMVDKRRIPQLIVPDLEDFELKPYVFTQAPKIKVRPMTWEVLEAATHNDVAIE